MFLGSISSGNETKDVFSGRKHRKMRTKQDWLSFFVIPLPCSQTTVKKEEKGQV
jgi:hypothetical protein